MRQAIGTTWVMQLVIIFMLIFVAFLALTINYTKAFKIKNELVSIIEKYEGINDTEGGSISLMNNYLQYNGHLVRGRCRGTEYGVSDLNSTIFEEAYKNEKYYYCLDKIYTGTASVPNRAKYNIRIFFNFGLPILGDLFSFSVEGTTIDITNTNPDDMIPD